ncbi:GFA family protein [Phormidium sp. CLA17]|uniref:GFA family protein n=1 Tax=Leptolyngbya sp. Cla-17 TaxID=2803751 RepID=UPI001491253A|nr:GFA family protein [Leptolyngbya sp. Cla-17]MBM0741255.1 GFA family protein [Leptolyngbya sp. Cla-17]
MTIYTGGCQCERIRYQLLAEPLTLYVCHCTECQKQSSSAFGMSMTIPREALIITQGQPQEWRRKGDSDREVVCFFCGNCGTRLFHQPERNPQITNLKPGTLDDTSWLQPVGHTWTRSAQPWFTIPKGTLQEEGQPADFTEFFQRFTPKIE